MIYFLIYLFLEVIISVNISSAIGGLATFLEILASAFLGIVLLVNFRDTFINNIRAVSLNCLSLEEFQRLNLFTVIGAILLILPGFFTDIIGLLMQFSVITTTIVNRYGVQSKKCSQDQFYGREEDEDIIEAEIIEHHTTVRK